MRRRTIWIWVLACGLAATGQNSTNFHWDWHKALYLAREDQLDLSPLLNTDEKRGLLRALSDRTESDDEISADLSQTAVRLIRLGSPPEKFFAVQAVNTCSATGNCQSWVVRQQGGSFSVILDGGSAKTFTVQPHVSNGLHDLVLGAHGSATLHGLFLYSFDGKQYKQIGCFEANWSVLNKEGEVQQLTSPRITPCRK